MNDGRIELHGQTIWDAPPIDTLMEILAQFFASDVFITGRMNTKLIRLPKITVIKVAKKSMRLMYVTFKYPLSKEYNYLKLSSEPHREEIRFSIERFIGTKKAFSKNVAIPNRQMNLTSQQEAQITSKITKGLNDAIQQSPVVHRRTAVNNGQMYDYGREAICHACGEYLDSTRDEICETCSWIICPYDGACGCR